MLGAMIFLNLSTLIMIYLAYTKKLEKNELKYYAILAIIFTIILCILPYKKHFENNKEYEIKIGNKTLVAQNYKKIDDILLVTLKDGEQRTYNIDDDKKIIIRKKLYDIIIKDNNKQVFKKVTSYKYKDGKLIMYVDGIMLPVKIKTSDFTISPYLEN